MIPYEEALKQQDTNAVSYEDALASVEKNTNAVSYDDAINSIAPITPPEPDIDLSEHQISDFGTPPTRIRSESEQRLEKDMPYFAKHDVQYGIFGVAKDIVPYIRYIDPEERDRFARLSTQKQTRELLLENLKTVIALGAPIYGAATSTAVKNLFAKHLPKTFKALKFVKTPIKEWSELLATPSKQLAGEHIAFGKKLVAQKIAAYKKIAGEHPKPETIKQFWEDAGRAVQANVQKKSAPAFTPKKSKVKPGTTEELGGPLLKLKETLNDSMRAGIKAAARKRREQEILYTKNRRQRIARAVEIRKQTPGEKGYQEQLKAMKGAMDRVDYTSIRHKFTQQDVDDLFQYTFNHAEAQGFDGLTAQRGLAKLLGEKGVAVPQQSELEILRKVFPKDFVESLEKTKGAWDLIKHNAMEAINVPRAIMSSFDLSAPLRQGLFFSTRKEFFPNFVKMFKLFSSEKAFNALQTSIIKRPTYKLMKESGLHLTEIGAKLTGREERFMSQMAERIPGIGRGVKASGRAYMGFLNKLRADVFDDMVRKARKVGRDPENDLTLLRQISQYINRATGRGGLGKKEFLSGSIKPPDGRSFADAESTIALLNGIFYSPRLMASRVQLLNPFYYTSPKLDPFVRKQALRDLFALSGLVGTTLGLAKTAGMTVGTDARSADFLKMKVGNTRYDILGGFQQYIRAAVQIITGEYVSSTSGKKVVLGEGFRPITRWEIFLRQLESKEAPVASFITTMMKGKDFSGLPVNVKKEVAKRFIPMVMQDAYEIAQEDPELLPTVALGVFGVGLQSYSGRPTRSRGGIQGIKALGSF